jgi:RimJ/RimL family protein N-acetyltransferase
MRILFEREQLLSRLLSDVHMDSVPLPTITGELVSLRPFTADDVASVAVLANDRTVRDGTRVTPFPYTEADARSWIAGHAASVASRVGYPFAVVERQSGDLVGAIEICPDRDEVEAYEIGYWIGAPHRGRGFATEAARLALAFAARNLPPGRVGAYVSAENVASRRVLAKCGMRLVETNAKDSDQDYFSRPDG